MKKLFVLFMLLALVMTALPVLADEQVKLVVWDQFTDDARGQAIVQINDLFRAAYPEITLETVSKDVEALDQTLKAAMMSGEGPDVYFHEMGIGAQSSYLKAGYLLNLSDTFKNLGWFDTLVPVSHEVSSVGDYIYGVGSEIESMSLYYNKTIFDELGLAAPNTVEELTACFAAIKAAGYTPLANTMDSGWWTNMNTMGTILYAFMSDAEIDAVMNQDASWDMESVRSAVSMVVDWLNNGYFPDHPEVDSDPTQTFINQEAVCYITGNWDIANFDSLIQVDFVTDVIPFPGSEKNPDGGSQVNFVGSGYLVNTQSANQDAALKYIDFVLNRADTAKIWYEVGKIIPPYTGKVEAEISPLLAKIQGFLADPENKNTAGINMWLGKHSFDFFSTCGQKLIIGALDVDSFVSEADAAMQQDVAEGGTKASFSFN